MNESEILFGYEICSFEVSVEGARMSVCTLITIFSFSLFLLLASHFFRC